MQLLSPCRSKRLWYFAIAPHSLPVLSAQLIHYLHHVFSSSHASGHVKVRVERKATWDVQSWCVQIYIITGTECKYWGAPRKLLEAKKNHWVRRQHIRIRLIFLFGALNMIESHERKIGYTTFIMLCVQQKGKNRRITVLKWLFIEVHYNEAI